MITGRQVVFAVAVIVSLAGCATAPTSSGRAQQVASAYPHAEITPTRGVISIIRDTGMMGSACKVYLLVDSVDVGYLEPGQRLEVGADPGPRVLTATVRGAICGGGTANLELNVKQGDTQYVRVGAMQSGDLRLDVAAPGYR